jgi:hypothetical protein
MPMKILFFAPDPRSTQASDGYTQRVAAIDAVFDGWDKTYAEENTEPEQLVGALSTADVIYVHSIYQARQLVPHIPEISKRLVLDLHGAVPEELQLTATKKLASKYEKIERLVLCECKYFVSVSQSMTDHFQGKYPVTNKDWVLLPIFEQGQSVGDMERDPFHIVYAGGVQPWQNVCLMVDAINRSPARYRFSILTHRPEAFAGIRDFSRVRIESVGSDEVRPYYLRAALGFLLRADTAVNRVACPTKLVEYMTAGVVPILLSPEIGDFNRLGYAYVKVDDFIEGRFDEHQVAAARDNNLHMLETLSRQSREGAEQLRRVCEGIAAETKSYYSAERARKNIARLQRADKIAQFQDRIPRIKGRVLRMLGISSK